MKLIALTLSLKYLLYKIDKKWDLFEVFQTYKDNIKKEHDFSLTSELEIKMQFLNT